MRTAFINKLTELAEKDRRIMLLVGDLGFGVVVDFAKRLPDQFINIGVAEQNMAGVATGLALAGKIVFTYSIANFPILRCLEQIRNDACYHKTNVIAVSVGAGVAYGSLGMTHQALEDIAIMRALPNLSLIAPGDPAETAQAVDYLAQGHGPAYLRLGRAGEPTVHKNPIQWRFGRAIEVLPGNDLTLIATGTMLQTAVAAAERLRTQSGLSARVLSMHTVKPIDEEAIREAAAETGRIVTLEEHSVAGGFGSAVAEVLAESGVNARFLRIGFPPVFAHEVGNQDYIKKCYGLDVDSVVERLTGFLRLHAQER